MSLPLDSLRNLLALVAITAGTTLVLSTILMEDQKCLESPALDVVMDERQSVRERFEARRKRLASFCQGSKET